MGERIAVKSLGLLSMAFIELQKEVLYNELKWFLETTIVSFQYMETYKL